MRILFIFLALMMWPLTASAQVPVPVEAPASSDADIETLVRILENDQTRAQLIERLQQTAGGEAPIEEPGNDLSIARQLAEYTRAVAEGTAATLRELGQLSVDLGQGIAGAGNADFDALRDAAIGVVLTGVALIGSFLFLRIVVRWLQKGIARRVAGRGWMLRIAGALGGAGIDAGSVLLAWGIGYVLALNVIGGRDGAMGINQSLLLNAFLFVEMTKMVVRSVLAPHAEPLRLLPINDSNAAYWSFWLGRVISLLGYAFMFVSPLVAANLSLATGGGIQLLAMVTAVIIGIIVVMQNKQPVRNQLAAWAHRRGDDNYGRFIMAAGQYWHMVAIAYLLALLVVWVTNPDHALPFMIGATIQTAIAILVGVLVVGFISRFVGIGLKLPDDIRQRLPLLEARLTTFVPTMMNIVRWVVVAAVLVAIAQAWAIFDFVGWISSEQGQGVAGSAISALLIVVACIVAYVVVASWVEYRLNTTINMPTAREKTLLNLFKNAFTVALAVFGLMLALGQIGVNIAPLLAGAGVIGLAIGFGAQKLVQDIITGIFIQFENVMNEGDVVEAAGKAGVVEKLTIRSVTIRDMSGTVHLIPFSSVDQVSNMVRGFSFYVAEFEVSRDSNIEEVKQAMRDAFAQVMETEHKDVILDDLDLQGLIAITPASMSLRARIKTLAGKQWGPGRLYSELVMRIFDDRGISTPTPRVSYIPGPSGGRLPAVGEPPFA
ncbi:mechanosensitive ion channel domain-containing protein [Devosia sp. SL43]|uniref:mechanosensitive ion channel domain-containing protein n=1 Tax=Devosia sp. SL43 TaxID=2806348 RepID=UPI001F01EDFF|nr:mechanosensitive ion channel domain-containing protein [Devosia sp. SL43]UJW83915.1 mechanosensitive ion channel [Devosia sp. SL43]